MLVEHFQVEHTQQYYEMIGKYAQFGRGWDDYGSDREWSVNYFSPRNLDYMRQRDASNEAFRKGTYIIMFGLAANHLASALDQFFFGDDSPLRVSAAAGGDGYTVSLTWRLGAVHE